MKNEKASNQNVKLRTVFSMSYARMDQLKFDKKKVRVFLSFLKTRMSCFSWFLSFFKTRISCCH